MRGRGADFLDHSLGILTRQKYSDFEVVISDHSINNDIENVYKKYKDQLEIQYFRNNRKRGNSSANINNAIQLARGDIIKVLFQDDFLFGDDALEVIHSNFLSNGNRWLITACCHSQDGNTFYKPFYPTWNNKLYLGKNTISSPSVLSFINNEPLLFDENLIWLMDCDYYQRSYNNFGPPVIVNTIGVVNRTGSHQVSNAVVNLITKIRELLYVIIKFNFNKSQKK